MSEIYFISDTHFSHQNILKFKSSDDKLIRGSMFSSIEDHDETIIKNWNDMVKPQDKIYHLGDVFFGSQERFNSIHRRLNGQKRLLPGNHDPIKFLSGKNPLNSQHYFQKIQLWRLFKDHNFIATHVPVHETTFRTSVDYNVHGHVHENSLESINYINISLENTNYKPVHIDELIKD